MLYTSGTIRKAGGGGGGGLLSGRRGGTLHEREGGGLQPPSPHPSLSKFPPRTALETSKYCIVSYPELRRIS